MNTNPTNDFYTFFQFIYEHYNTTLYNGELPNCMFVIVRKRNTFGYFIPERWVNDQKIKSDEIAINPLMFGSYPLIEILKTIVHEMCHLWQFHFGEASVRTYHNKQWGDKLQSIGLMPSNTGLEGGKKTGQQMMEYIINDGPFIKQTNLLIESKIFKKLWYDRFMNAPIIMESLEENPSDGLQIEIIDRRTIDSEIRQELINNITTEGVFNQKKKKIKYSCSSCYTNVWGKPDINIKCNDCDEDFIAK